jgi:predicted acetyltransferase
MAEFYSFPEVRRTGTALPFARAVMARFPGEWELTEFAAHTAAVAFWKRVLGDTPFTESSYVGQTSGKARLRQVFEVSSSSWED